MNFIGGSTVLDIGSQCASAAEKPRQF